MMNEEHEHDDDVEEVLISHLEKLNILPLDIRAVISPTLGIYGDLGHGPLIGSWVLFTDGSINDLHGRNHAAESCLTGRIIGDNHGRVVISLGEGYLGWLTPEQYRLVNVVIPNIHWIH